MPQNNNCHRHICALPPLQLGVMGAPVHFLHGVEVGARWWCHLPLEASKCTVPHCPWTLPPGKENMIQSSVNQTFIHVFDVCKVVLGCQGLCVWVVCPKTYELGKFSFVCSINKQWPCCTVWVNYARVYNKANAIVLKFRMTHFLCGSGMSFSDLDKFIDPTPCIKIQNKGKIVVCVRPQIIMCLSHV